MTRIVSCPYKIWEYICKTNQENILKMIQEFRNYMETLEGKPRNGPSRSKKNYKKKEIKRNPLN